MRPPPCGAVNLRSRDESWWRFFFGLAVTVKSTFSRQTQQEDRSEVSSLELGGPLVSRGPAVQP